MIYFIQAASGPVKIGSTDGVLAFRFPSMQSANHETLTIIRTIDGGPLGERWLQRHFRGLRIRGEWFRFSEEMMTILPPENGAAKEVIKLHADGAHPRIIRNKTGLSLERIAALVASN